MVSFKAAAFNLHQNPNLSFYSTNFIYKVPSQGQLNPKSESSSSTVTIFIHTCFGLNYTVIIQQLKFNSATIRSQFPRITTLE